MEAWDGVLAIVEIVLLIAELILISISLSEIRRATRTHKLLSENTTATKSNVEAIQTSIRVTSDSVTTITTSIKLLQRDQIYFYLAETAKSAKEFIHHLSIAQSTSEIQDEEEQKRVKEFLESLSAASKTLTDIKVLGPDVSSKVGGLWQRREMGAAVRVSQVVTAYDFRMQIVDRKKVVIGIAPPDTKSQFGFLIESFKLAEILDDNFMQLWNTAKDLDQHIRDVVSRHINPYAEQSLLDEQIRSLLHVPTFDMSREIIGMLIQSQYLHQGINERVYLKSLLEELRVLPDLSLEIICKYIEAKHIPISMYQAEKIMDDLISLKDRDEVHK